MKTEYPLFRWTWSEQDGAFSAKLGTLVFLCEEPGECHAEELAENIAFEYKSRLPALAAYLRAEQPELLGARTLKDLTAALGNPVIDLDSGILTYPEQTLDTGHPFDVEFKGILEEFVSFRVNG